jgi:hypothetical protein
MIGEGAMATVNFSVPEDGKREFDKAFAGKNKSRVIADLMSRRRAIALLRDLSPA